VNQIGARQNLEKLHRQVCDTADPSAGIAEFAGIFLEVFDELLNSLG